MKTIALFDTPFSYNLKYIAKKVKVIIDRKPLTFIVKKVNANFTLKDGREVKVELKPIVYRFPSKVDFKKFNVIIDKLLGHRHHYVVMYEINFTIDNSRFDKDKKNDKDIFSLFATLLNIIKKAKSKLNIYFLMFGVVDDELINSRKDLYETMVNALRKKFNFKYKYRMQNDSKDYWVLLDPDMLKEKGTLLSKQLDSTPFKITSSEKQFILKRREQWQIQ